MDLFKRYRTSDKGGTMAEYAAIVLLVLLAVVGVFMLFGLSINDLITPVANIF